MSAVGDIIEFGGSTAPAGRLLCNGAAVSRATYDDLFAVVGTTYGSGDGSTTFNVPNSSGKTIVHEVNISTSGDLELRGIAELDEETSPGSETYGHFIIDGVSKSIKKENLLTKSDVGLGNADNTSDADKPISTSQAAVNTAQATTNGLKFDKADLSTETDLGTNATTLDATKRYYLRFKGIYTSSQTLTISNASNINNFKARITNTNANTLTFSGITLYFKTDDLPDGVTFASNALTFPADSAVKYNIVGELFDDEFDCKIEIR